MSRVLITGATGFLGAALVPVLRAAGHEVLATGRDPARLAALADAGCATLPLDLAQPVPDSTAHSIGRLDAVVHCAALSAPSGRRARFIAANVTATRHLLSLARGAGVRRFVNISSPSVYFAPRDQLDVAEDMPLPRPFNHYAATKARAEALVLAQGDLGPVSLRPRGIYGPGDRALLPRLLQAAARRPLPMLRGGRAAIDLTHVDDVTRAIRAALEAGPGAEGQSINISGGEMLPLRHIIDAACARAGITPRWRAMPYRPLVLRARGLEAAHAAWPGAPREPAITAYGLAILAFRQSLALGRAAQLLDWHPRIGFAEGLERTFAAARARA